MRKEHDEILVGCEGMEKAWLSGLVEKKSSLLVSVIIGKRS